MAEKKAPKPFTKRQIKSERLAAQMEPVPVNTAKEKALRRDRMGGHSTSIPGHPWIGGPVDMEEDNTPPGVFQALLNTTAPLKDIEVLRGTDLSYGGNWAGNSGMYNPAYEDSPDRPKDWDERNPRAPKGGPSIWINGAQASTAEDATAITHELGHALQYRDVVRREGESGVYGDFSEDGTRGGTPHPIYKTPESLAQNGFHAYHGAISPWIEGGAMGYEARYTPTTYLKAVRRDQSYDDPQYWKTQNFGKDFGVHAASVYRLAKARARNTGDPGNILDLHDALRPILHKTDAAGQEYRDAVSRMALNYTTRTLAPDQFNMMAAPYENERKERTEAAGLEFKPRERPEFGDRKA